MIRRVVQAAARLCRDVRGSVAVMMAAAMIMLVGFAAIIVDLGYLYYVEGVLQSTADKAALAGAQDINCCSGSPGKALSTAVTYSAAPGGLNEKPGLNITMEPGYPALQCFSSIGMPCTGPDSANGIVVKQQTEVPVFFARIFGASSIPLSVTSVAAKGGAIQPADVIIVLDTTASMNTPDPSCGIPNSSRLSCALTGFRALLSGFSATQNRVGLVTFPGLKPSVSVATEYDCNSLTPSLQDNTKANSDIAWYDQSPTYLIVPLTSDYQKADGSLNANSDLVKVAGGVPGCAGISALGGPGTYYADAMSATATYLAANARPNVQKVMIVLGDGDANVTPKNNNKGACQQAIVAAQQAQAAGIQVITIAYGAPAGKNTGDPSEPISCKTDPSPEMTACATMQKMASDPLKFYSDTVGGTSACTSAANPATDLTAIFQQIVTSLTGTRLLPSNTL